MMVVLRPVLPPPILTASYSALGSGERHCSGQFWWPDSALRARDRIEKRNGPHRSAGIDAADYQHRAPAPSSINATGCLSQMRIAAFVGLGNVALTTPLDTAVQIEKGRI